MQKLTRARRVRRAAGVLWMTAGTLLAGCSWLHLGTADDDAYDYRKAKPTNQPLDVPPDLSQLPKDDRFSLPSAKAAAAPANAAPNAAPAAAQPAPGAPVAVAAVAPPPSATAPGPAPAAANINTAPTTPLWGNPGVVSAPSAALPAAAAAPAPAAAAQPPMAVAVADAALPPAAAGVLVSPPTPNAQIMRDGSVHWLAVNVSPEVAYTTLKDMWAGLGFKIQRDEPLIGVVETDYSEIHPVISEDMLRNGLHKAFGAFDSNGIRNQFVARIERTPANTSEITITDRAMVEVVTGVYKDSSKWQAAPPDPELEVEMLRRLALRFAPAQPLRVAVATSSAAPVPAAAPSAAPAPQAAPAPVAVVASAPPVPMPAAASASSRVHKVTSGGNLTLQVEDSMDRTWRLVGVALDRGGFTVEDRRRDKSVYAVRYLDPEYEAREREKRSWWDRVFNSDAKIPEQQFLIALMGNGATTAVEVQDKDGHPDNGSTASRILDQLMEQMQ